jgi:ABC-type spermidine/putrescine transport system permease subunit II
MRPRLLSLYAVGAFAFLHLPLAILAVFSFNASRFTVWQGFSLHWYGALAQDRELMEAAVNSLTIAAVSTLLATIAGTLAAY